MKGAGQGRRGGEEGRRTVGDGEMGRRGGGEAGRLRRLRRYRFWGDEKMRGGRMIGG